ncbi:MAG: hypothetical protein M1819_005257 [Sarea resinae]|nr:MAG: hypothetical protein M1819_005257 [Sarea resinae]
MSQKTKNAIWEAIKILHSGNFTIAMLFSKHHWQWHLLQEEGTGTSEDSWCFYPWSRDLQINQLSEASSTSSTSSGEALQQSYSRLTAGSTRRLRSKSQRAAHEFMIDLYLGPDKFPNQKPERLGFSTHTYQVCKGIDQINWSYFKTGDHRPKQLTTTKASEFLPG